MGEILTRELAHLVTQLGKPTSSAQSESLEPTLP